MNETGSSPIGAAMLLFRAIVGGVVCLLGVWIGILVTHAWRLKSAATRQGAAGFGATAGGWTFLLHSPAVAILLTIGFGLGFFAVVRWSR